MGFKKMETNLTFTDISLFPSMEHNRAIARMEHRAGLGKLDSDISGKAAL
jgi:hypothetical protein